MFFANQLPMQVLRSRISSKVLLDADKGPPRDVVHFLPLGTARGRRRDYRSDDERIHDRLKLNRKTADYTNKNKLTGPTGYLLCTYDI